MQVTEKQTTTFFFASGRRWLFTPQPDSIFFVHVFGSSHYSTQKKKKTPAIGGWRFSVAATGV
jgi:hypothetical protein